MIVKLKPKKHKIEEMPEEDFFNYANDFFAMKRAQRRRIDEYLHQERKQKIINVLSFLNAAAIAILTIIFLYLTTNMTIFIISLAGAFVALARWKK